MSNDTDRTERVDGPSVPETGKPAPKLRRIVGDKYRLLGSNPRYNRFGKDAIDGDTELEPNTILHANLGVWKDSSKLPVQEDRVIKAEYLTEDGRKATRLAVGDGMGGHGCGDVAAQLFAEAIAKPQSYAEAEAETRRRLAELAARDLKYKESGVCTAVATIVGNTLYRNRRGDARIYVFSRDGTLKSLTRDENVYYGDRPAADPRHNEQDALRRATEKSVSGHKNNTVTNDLSLVKANKPEDPLDPVELEEGDVVFVCSDGVSDNLTAPEIWAALQTGYPHAMTQAVRAKMDGQFNRFHYDQTQGGAKGLPGKADNFAYAAYVHGKAPAWWPKPKTYGEQLRKVLGL